MPLMRAGLLLCVLGVATGCASAPAPAAAPPQRPCPHSDRPRLSNRGSALHARLVPAGATALELCRYRGLNPPGGFGRLILSRRVTNAGTVRSLAKGLDALPRVPSGAFDCPADDGSQVLAIFGYPRRDPVTIRVKMRGCQVVTNGVITRWATTAAGERLVGRLSRLTAG